MAHPFKFYADWVKFGDILRDDEERVRYYRAISRYGAYGENPKTLKGIALEYFNDHIRPNIDKQHKILRDERYE